MKCFKKKLATGLLVVSVVCGFGSSVFAESNNCIDVFHDNDMRVLSCKINGNEFVIVRKLIADGGIAITQVK